MKKFTSYLLASLFVAMTVFVTSCNNDDDDVSPTATTYAAGTDAATNRTSLTVTDRGEGTGTTTWTKDNVYVLNGLVFVNSGQTLTIQAGTVIKGKPGTGESASAFVVARGGTVIAEGTAAEPIIFTYEGDALDGTPDAKESEWGGVVILGNAGLNSTPGETAIEGISTSETRGLYGGSNDTDNSGTMKYIQIRNGGTDIGADNELNGLSLGGVGSGTTLDYIEIFYNKDDGIEFFGGTVGVTHLVVGYCGDDAIDYDEGYRGVNQFAFVFQGSTRGDCGGEHDGGTSPEDGTPFATPQFWNVTSVGNSGNRTITFRDNAGGIYNNGVFANYGRGIDIEYLTSTSSKNRWDDGGLSLNNNTFVNVANGTAADLLYITKGDGVSDADSTTFAGVLQAQFTNLGNQVDNSFITTANPVPSAAGSPITNGAPTTAAYRGAFAPGSTTWYTGWTALAAFGLDK